MNSEQMFEPGTLWSRILESTSRALAAGALHSIPTEPGFIEEAGTGFLVRVVANLVRKDEARHALEVADGRVPRDRSNPFLPYDEVMFVARVSPGHVCLLNKYNVVEHHVLIVTRDFEHQECLLTLEDLGALWSCLAEVAGLGFYNAGVVAGASQPHKHLQLIPLPMSDRGPAVPLGPAIEAARGAAWEVTSSPRLPFPHRVARFDGEPWRSPGRAAHRCHALYLDMLEALGVARRAAAGCTRTGTYNLLITRDWMLLVPRVHERFESISLNALAFAGGLLVRSIEQREVLERFGCMAALGRAAGMDIDGAG